MTWMSTYPNSKNTLRKDVQNTIHSSSININLQGDVLKRNKNIATCANIILGIHFWGEKLPVVINW